jgi:hypothetical protein
MTELVQENYLATFDQDILTELLRDKRLPLTFCIVFNQLIQFIQKVELLLTMLIPKAGYSNRYKYSGYYRRGSKVSTLG